MDRLWTPWRYQYLAGTASASTSGEAKPCIFCAMAADASHDEEALVVFRGERNFVVLNRYPYSNGHLMVVPFEHAAELSAVPRETAAEMMELTRAAEIRLRELYRPHGLNIGMNLGESAGAGIAGHIHMHVLPRWTGDANFMTTVGETRVLPEELSVTRRRLANAFARR